MDADWQQIKYSICLWTWTHIVGQNPPTDANAVVQNPHHSGVHFHCPRHFARDGRFAKDVRIPEFWPRIPSAFAIASAIMSPSPGILNLHLPKKTFQTCVPSTYNSVSALLSNDYVTVQWPRLSEVTTTAIHCILFNCSLHGREITDKTDNTETGGGMQHLWAYSHQILTTTAWYCEYSASDNIQNSENLCWLPNSSPDT